MNLRPLAYWLCPQGIRDAMNRWKLAPRLDPALRPFLQKNAPLVNHYRGGRCFVLCTGSSIQQQDLSVLIGEACISVSGFYLHPLFSQIRPLYQVFNGITTHTSPELHTLETNLASFRQMLERVGTTPIVTQVEDAALLQKVGMHEAVRSCYYIWKHWTQWHQMPQAEINLTSLIPNTTNGAMFGIMWALGLGFSEICLLGVDNDYVLRFNEKAVAHFYKPDECIVERSGRSEWEFIPSLEKLMRDQAETMVHFRLLREYAALRGQRIINATAGGLLDVFPRVHLDEYARAGLQAQAPTAEHSLALQ